MNKRGVVVDTVGLISYYSSIFNTKVKISNNAISLIGAAFHHDSNILLSIPSIVFIELFDKWVKGEEFAALFRSEILEPIKRAPNIEIKPIDEEVLEIFSQLSDADINLENHDKTILASAIMLKWELITTDKKITSYVEKYNVIPGIIS